MINLSNKRNNFGIMYLNLGRIYSFMLNFRLVDLIKRSEVANVVPMRMHVQSVYTLALPKCVETFILYEVRVYGSVCPRKYGEYVYDPVNNISLVEGLNL
jgi:hypothetical protein